MKKEPIIHCFLQYHSKELIVPLQAKNVSIIIVGIIHDWAKEDFIKKSMAAMAGKKGKLLMFDNFDEVYDNFDEVLAAACGKLRFVYLVLCAPMPSIV